MTEPTTKIQYIRGNLSADNPNEHWIVTLITPENLPSLGEYIRIGGDVGGRYRFLTKEAAQAAERLYHMKNEPEKPETSAEKGMNRFCEDCNNWATCTKKVIRMVSFCSHFVPKLSTEGETAKFKAENIKEINPKYAEGIKKAPLHCIPCGPLFEIGLAMFEGSRKYGRHNYRAMGVRASVYYDATMGHLMDWWEGEDIDPDSGLHHLIKAVGCLIVVRDSMLMGNFNDDRPLRYPEKHGRSEFNAQVKGITEKFPNCAKPFLETGKSCGI